mmetsp:Transcript_16765/g.24853  ORF Transcript_16765/g.24853 Transcript_16765/m.24853 type:complete len:91 (+) Transcript_16765:2588-2860(+)
MIFYFVWGVAFFMQLFFGGAMDPLFLSSCACSLADLWCVYTRAYDCTLQCGCTAGKDLFSEGYVSDLDVVEILGLHVLLDVMQVSPVLRR